MKDRIKVNSEVLDRWASQLGEVSSALDDALSILNDLDTSGEWWGKVGNLSSLSLMLAGQTVSLGDARGAVCHGGRRCGPHVLDEAHGAPPNPWNG